MEAVDLGRGRNLQARIDIDDECGGTEESEDISDRERYQEFKRKSSEEEECIYYEG